MQKQLLYTKPGSWRARAEPQKSQIRNKNLEGAKVKTY